MLLSHLLNKWLHDNETKREVVPRFPDNAQHNYIRANLSDEGISRVKSTVLKMIGIEDKLTLERLNEELEHDLRYIKPSSSQECFIAGNSSRFCNLLERDALLLFPRTISLMMSCLKVMLSMSKFCESGDSFIVWGTCGDLVDKRIQLWNDIDRTIPLSKVDGLDDDIMVRRNIMYMSTFRDIDYILDRIRTTRHKKLVVFGHGIEGMYALIIGLLAVKRFNIERPTVVTFGLRMMGNKSFSDAVSRDINHICVINRNDPYPSIKLGDDFVRCAASEYVYTFPDKPALFLREDPYFEPVIPTWKNLCLLALFGGDGSMDSEHIVHGGYIDGVVSAFKHQRRILLENMD